MSVTDDDDPMKAAAYGDFVIFCDRVENALSVGRDLDHLFELYKDALVKHNFFPRAYLRGGRLNENGVIRNPHRYSDNRFHNNLIIYAYEHIVSELG